MMDPRAVLSGYDVTTTTHPPVRWERVHALTPVRGEPVNIPRQQLRAHNLAWALSKVDGQAQVAIVGGGFAGLTFAVAAALQGMKVVVLEQSARLLFAQWKSYDRYLHPQLFDWPAGSWRQHHTEHTALGWSHNFAAAVRAVALQQVPANGLLSIECESLVRRVEAQRDTVAINVVALDGSGELGELERLFDRVVIASGFPMERPEHGARGGSYWRTPTDPASIEGPGGVRIVGNGDGALTELITLGVEGFRQDSLRNVVGNLDEVAGLCPLVAPRWSHLTDKLKNGQPIVTSLGGRATSLPMTLFSNEEKLTEGSFALNAATAVAVERARIAGGLPEVFDPPAKRLYGETDAAADRAKGRTIVWRVGPGATSRLLDDLGFVPAPAPGAADRSAAHWGPDFHDQVRTPVLEHARAEARDRTLPGKGQAVTRAFSNPLATDSTDADREDAELALHALASTALWLHGVQPMYIDGSAVRVVGSRVHMSVDAIGAVASLPACVVLDSLVASTGMLQQAHGRLFARLHAKDVWKSSDLKRFDEIALHVAVDALQIFRDLSSESASDERLPTARDIDGYVRDRRLAQLLMLGIRARRRRVGLPAAVLAALQRLATESDDLSSPSRLLRLVAIALVPATARSQARVGLVRLGRACGAQAWIYDELLSFLQPTALLEEGALDLGDELVLDALRPIRPLLGETRALPITQTVVEQWVRAVAPRRGRGSSPVLREQLEGFASELRRLVEGLRHPRGQDLTSEIEGIAVEGGVAELLGAQAADPGVLARFGLRPASAG